MKCLSLSLRHLLGFLLFYFFKDLLISKSYTERGKEIFRLLVHSPPEGHNKPEISPA